MAAHREGKTALAWMTVRALAEQAIEELVSQTVPVSEVNLPVFVRMEDVARLGLEEAVRASLRDGDG